MSKNKSLIVPVEPISLQTSPIQLSPLKVPPLSKLSVAIKEELYMALVYIRGGLPMLSHVIVHDITVTSEWLKIPLLTKSDYTPYKLLVVLSSNYPEESDYLITFTKALNSFFKQKVFLYPPAVTFIGEKEFLASLKMDNNMISDSVGCGRIIVDVEIEKDWIWND